MSEATIDHKEIRRWAESKGGKPAAVDRTHKGESVGIIRIMFPERQQSEHDSLVEISWDEFFKQFEESNLALLYETDSLFSKIVGRDTLERREHGEHASRHHPASVGGQKQGGQSASSGRSADGARKADGGGKDSGDLKAREYRDAQGEVHHHTREYMEQHRRS